MSQAMSTPCGDGHLVPPDFVESPHPPARLIHAIVFSISPSSSSEGCAPYSARTDCTVENILGTFPPPVPPVPPPVPPVPVHPPVVPFITVPSAVPQTSLILSRLPLTVSGSLATDVMVIVPVGATRRGAAVIEVRDGVLLPGLVVHPPGPGVVTVLHTPFLHPAEQSVLVVQLFLVPLIVKPEVL